MEGAHMSELYEDGHRRLQRQFDTERLADRIEQTLLRTALTADDQAFVERLDLFFLATVNAKGEPSCSYKGGDPGFVRVLEPKTLVFPCYDGNGMFLSMGNLEGEPQRWTIVHRPVQPETAARERHGASRACGVRLAGVSGGSVRSGRERTRGIS
jgi:hypothetical protein